jgi:hypothetical protein
VPLLLLQAFAASTGFVAHARRGYYDHLLTSGVPRLTAAAAHWALSAGPGISWWAVMAATEVAVAGSSTLVTPGGVAALCLVSTLPWAGTLALPRFTAALTWLVLAVMALTIGPFAGESVWSTEVRPLWHAVPAALLFPTRLLDGPLLRDLAAAGVVGTVAAGAMAVAGVRVHRAVLRLESAQ